MLDLYLIRHAESEMNNQSHLVGGRSDGTHLSKRGYQQAKLLGERLRNSKVNFDKIYSSTAVRAYQTALTASKEQGIQQSSIITLDDLLELDQGDWEGVHRDLVYTPENIKIMNQDHWNFAAPNGESQRDVEERMLNFVNSELKNKDITAGVYSHGMAIKCLLRGILNSDPEITYKIVIDNTSITRLKYTDRGWHLLGINDIAHIYGMEKIEDRHSS